MRKGASTCQSRPGATLEAQKRLSGEVNYLVGDDPAKWQQGIPTHDDLLYGGLWPGIDMVSLSLVSSGLQDSVRVRGGGRITPLQYLLLNRVG